LLILSSIMEKYIGGIIGDKNIRSIDTSIYNAYIEYTTVENANILASDVSEYGLSGSTIFLE